MHEPTTSQFQLWSLPWLLALAAWFDDRARPTLAGLAIISSGTAVVGYAGYYDTPTLEAYLRCLALGFALWLIARTFWAGAWLLPALETKTALVAYLIVSVLGFGMFATVSTLGSVGATGGGISEEVTQSAGIDALANAGQEFALYGSQMAVIRAALAERRDQAGASAEAEISGRGPTGVSGPGPVSNAFRAAESKYAEAVDLLDAALSKGEGHVARLGETITAMRALQVDPDLSRAERSAKLKALSGTAIGEMRALLALDPARSITAAAGIVATGVPEPSRAPASSRARIAEIRDGMTAYAGSLQVEAERIAALAPEIPEQTTQSPAERLIANMWRMPGLTMAALLLDLCGWIAIGFRMAIYTALRAKMEEEKGEEGPQYILVDDLRRLKGILEAADETRREIEDLRPVAKRGRPPLSATKKRARDLGADQEGGE